MITRLAKRSAGKHAVKHLPFFKVLGLAQVGLLAHNHLRRLGPGEARRLAELVRRGRDLSPSERAELRTLTAKLEPRAFVGGAADRLSPVPLPRRFTGVK